LIQEKHNEIGPHSSSDHWISVIISVYNSARTLDKCIESIATQSHENWEIIIVDSYSKDGTTNIIENWVRRLGKERCRYFNVKRYGQTAKRNFGLKQARNGFLFFIDDDQYLPPKAFEECLRLIEKGNDGIHIPQVSNFEGKSYFSKCSILSIELFTGEEDIRVPSMIKSDHAELLYQDEDLDWVDDSLTLARFKEKDLRIASIRTPMVHDRDVPMRSLMLKTKFTVLARKKQSGEQIVDDRFMRAFPKKMLWLVRSQPTNVPGVLFAFLVRVSVRTMSMI
jgi:glycosyltransferase involved in cell wall biosynthesis